MNYFIAISVVLYLLGAAVSYRLLRRFGGSTSESLIIALIWPVFAIYLIY